MDHYTEQSCAVTHLAMFRLAAWTAGSSLFQLLQLQRSQTYILCSVQLGICTCKMQLRSIGVRLLLPSLWVASNHPGGILCLWWGCKAGMNVRWTAGFQILVLWIRSHPLLSWLCLFQWNQRSLHGVPCPPSSSTFQQQFWLWMATWASHHVPLS